MPWFKYLNALPTARMLKYLSNSGKLIPNGVYKLHFRVMPWRNVASRKLIDRLLD
jgi:hypothetical protein